MLNVEWRIAKRYLWGRRREGFLHVITGFSFLGICLGVATLIIVIAAFNIIAGLVMLVKDKVADI